MGETLVRLLEEEVIALRSLLEEIKGRLEEIKGRFDTIEDMFYWQAQVKNARSAWEKACAERDAIAEELTLCTAENAAMQAELSALRPDVDSEAVVHSRWVEIWAETADVPRRCRYPVAIWRPVVGRSRIGRESHWIGGLAQRELFALAHREGLILTHRELANLRAFAAEWDAMAEQAMNDSIPW